MTIPLSRYKTRLITTAAGVLFLIWLAGGVWSSEHTGYDSHILLEMRPGIQKTLPFPQAVTDSWMIAVTHLGGYRFLTGFILITALWHWKKTRQENKGTKLVLAAASALLASHGLKALFARPRPDLLEPLIETTTYSFPSGHAFLSAVVYLLVACLLTSNIKSRPCRISIWVVSITMTGLVGLSRIYLGVHWPSDVLAGWILGALWALWWCPSMKIPEKHSTGLCGQHKERQTC